MRAILHHRAILQGPRSRRPTTSQGVAASQANHSASKQRAALLTLACDFMFLMVSVGVAIVFRAVVIALWPQSGSSVEKGIVEWFAVLALLGGWLWFLGLDALRCIKPSRLLPFEYTERVVQHIYLRRMEISLWMIASSLTLLCLCLFFVGTPLISKLFLASLVALVVLAVRKSIPFGRLSFAIAVGIFFASTIAIAISSVLIPTEQPARAVEAEVENGG